MADDSWYYAQNNQQLGPVTLAALRQMIASGQVGAADLVWTQGMPQWQPARSIPELAGAVAGPTGAPDVSSTGYAPPPPPPQAGGYVPPPGGYAPPPPPGQAPIGYYGDPPGAGNQSSRATSALVLGIASLPLCLCPFVGIGLGVAAVIVGKGVQDGPDKGKARAGIICGIIGIAIGVLNAIAGVMLQFGQGGRGW